MPDSPPIIASLLNHCQQKIYGSKQPIIQVGEPSNHLFYIINGSVTVSLGNHKDHEMIGKHKDREIVLSYLNAGEFFGELGLFHKDITRSAFVIAKSKSNIASIDYNKLKCLNNIFPKILFLLASQMAMRVYKTSIKVNDLVTIDVRGRVARALLDLCEEPDAMTHPDGMQIRVTRQELGRIVGGSREMVGRVLKNLEAERLISVSGKSIVVFGTR